MPATMSAEDRDYWMDRAMERALQDDDDEDATAAVGCRYWRLPAPPLDDQDVSALRRMGLCAVWRCANVLVFAEPETQRWVEHMACAALRREVLPVPSSHAELLRLTATPWREPSAADLAARAARQEQRDAVRGARNL